VKCFLFSKIVAKILVSTIKFDIWHKIEIMVKGNHIWVIIEKKLIIDNLEIEGLIKESGSIGFGTNAAKCMWGGFKVEKIKSTQTDGIMKLSNAKNSQKNKSEGESSKSSISAFDPNAGAEQGSGVDDQANKGKVSSENGKNKNGFQKCLKNSTYAARKEWCINEIHSRYIEVCTRDYCEVCCSL